MRSAPTMSSMPTVTSSSRSICGRNISIRKFRDRAPRLFIDEDGKERLRIDGKAFGGRKGLGARRGRRPRRRRLRRYADLQ